jgi:hypothetical protein
MRLIQLRRANIRHVAVVEEPKLRLLPDSTSIYALASAAISSGDTLTELVQKLL